MVAGFLSTGRHVYLTDALKCQVNSAWENNFALFCFLFYFFFLIYPLNFIDAKTMQYHNYTVLLYRHECFTGKYTTRKIHKRYIRDPSGLFSIISLVSLSMTYFRSFPSIILSMSFCLYNKKNITRRLEDMNFIFSWQKQYLTHSLRSFVKYCFATRK